MRYKILGKTNLKVSQVGFGGIPLQHVDINEVPQLINELIINKINFIDTARGYTVSEKYIGYGLKITNSRENFILATKSMARTYEGMWKDIEESLVNLQTDYIDLYQLHNVSSQKDYDIIMSDDGAYKALVEAKEQGKIHHIGITSHNIDFISSISDDFIFDTLQFPFNIIERQAINVFSKLAMHNIGIITMKPLAGGAIDKAIVALKFVLNNNDVALAIPGMESVNQIKENSLIDNISLSEDDKKYIDKIQNELGNGFCRRCGYCMPCTKGINIPSCFLFEGYYTRYNLKEWAISRYEQLTVKANECIECGNCIERCPYHLDIINKLKKVNEVFSK